MTESVRAVRATVQIGSLTVDGFQLPDGGYRMSLTQAAECVGKPARSTFDFLRSKALKGLLIEAGSTFDFLPEDTVAALATNTYTVEKFLVDIGEEGGQGQTRITGVPLEIVILYWHWESFRGNKQAFFLVTGLATETLERRFDSAFGVTRTEEERNALLTQRVQRLERDLEILGNAYATEDEIRRERDYFERLLRDNGIEPYQPNQEV
ncbi:hypothetical protein [Kamptonema sp. UHCC 0994]|uniref:hypothetical protein n=1 Tax=Kamptonema sp. UHCC 0994 TaxID=3031329 RepID=UPI0023B96A45|nr:hypothetical protein [Kamptonema sp. UHCC 0994]MDF0553121.1 hypothetical protein [Kamptonema sp. UHCC 0994]